MLRVCFNVGYSTRVHVTSHKYHLISTDCIRFTPHFENCYYRIHFHLNVLPCPMCNPTDFPGISADSNGIRGHSIHMWRLVAETWQGIVCAMVCSCAELQFVQAMRCVAHDKNKIHTCYTGL